MSRKPSETYVKRSDAAAFIEAVRVAMVDAQGTSKLAVDVERALELLRLPPLTPCLGAAHGNPYIDNCSICAPRWGLVGHKVVVR